MGASQTYEQTQTHNHLIAEIRSLLNDPATIRGYYLFKADNTTGGH